MKKYHSDEENFKDENLFKVTAKPMTTFYECNIDDVFVHSSQFDDIVYILENAVDGDIIKMNLSSDGGSLVAVLPVLGAMEKTKAHVHCHIVSDIASACTFLPMYAGSVDINNYVSVMFHNVHYVTAGTGHTVKDYVDYTDKATYKLLHDMYHHFFDEDEISRILQGKEYWMDSEEFMLRYEMMMDEREKEMAEFMEAISGKDKPDDVDKEV